MTCRQKGQRAVAAVLHCSVRDLYGLSLNDAEAAWHRSVCTSIVSATFLSGLLQMRRLRRRDLCSAGGIRAWGGSRPGIANDWTTILAGRIEVPIFSLRTFEYRSRPLLDVKREDIRHFPLLSPTLTIDNDLAFARLPEPLRVLTCCAEDHVGDRIVVIGYRLCAQSACFEWDGPATGERIEYDRRIPAESGPHEITSDTQDFLPLWILWIRCLPLHQGTVVQKILRLRHGHALPASKQVLPATTWR